MPAGSNNIDQNVWSSVSTIQNVEHIFFQLPAGNRAYELWVRKANNTPENAYFALAWWAEAAPAPEPRQLGGFLWNDANSNGIQDAGEAGVQGASVQLYSAAGVLIDSAMTDYYGDYNFEVSPGSYYVKFIAPYAKGFTIEGAGTDGTLDSDADANGQTASFTVGSTDVMNIDAGLVPLNYGSIGSFVWNDTDGNGIQDAGEAGIPGVDVTLYTASGDYFSTATTDSSGAYHFNTVAPGSYYVVFTAPAVYAFSPSFQGSNTALDSDADSSGKSPTFSLGLGENNAQVDAGLVLAGGSIAGFTWEDYNHDGIQNPDEQGVSSVTVDLYTSTGSLAASTTTDDDGHYSFTTIAPGNYYVVFEAPYGYSFTTQGAGSDGTLDSDANSSGQTATFSIALGSNTTSLDAGLQGLPVANDDSASTNGTSPVTINVLANDGDPEDDPLTVTSVTAPAHGTAVINADNTVTYTPDATFFTTDNFSYTISDGNGGTATASVIINLSAQPQVNGLSRTTGPSGGGYTVTITGVGFTGATYVNFGSAQAPSITVNSDTSITATAPPHTRVAVDVTVTNSYGISPTSSADVFTYINGAPSGANHTASTFENSYYTFAASDFGFTDLSDGPADAFLAVRITTLPSVGTLTLNGSAVTAGEFISVTDINSGFLRFTPTANTYGTSYDAFTFQVQDNGGTANGGIDLDPIARIMTINVWPM